MAQERLSSIRLEGYQPLREMVLNVLREAIMFGKLPPGERLMEVQLAEELGVSRTPVREAIRHLELEGFVVMVPRKGAYVASLSAKDITNVFEVRTAMEVLAAGLAAERATPEEVEELRRLCDGCSQVWANDDMESWTKLDNSFHDLIYKSTHNDKLVSIASTIAEQMNRYKRMSFSTSKLRHISGEEHFLIFNAIASKDVAEARKQAENHIENTQKALFLSLIHIYSLLLWPASQ